MNKPAFQFIVCYDLRAQDQNTAWTELKTFIEIHQIPGLGRDATWCLTTESERLAFMQRQLDVAYNPKWNTWNVRSCHKVIKILSEAPRREDLFPHTADGLTDISAYE